MEVKLYDNDLSSPTFIEDITHKVQGLKFSTKLNGGFYKCSARLKADLPEAWNWLINKPFYRLVITDKTKTLWEGRLEEPNLEFGQASFVAYGYYANLGDVPYHTAYNDNFDAVIKAILTANCTQISSDQTNIAATGGPAITSGAGAGYLDIYPKDIVEKLANFSDDTYNGKWYFGIWEDRVPYLVRRNVTSLNWQVDISDFARFKLNHFFNKLWNSCYAVYESGGSITRTADADNSDSQTKYGLKRQYVIENLGEVAAAAAQSARDAWLEEHKEVWPQMNDMVLGNKIYSAVSDSKGVIYPSSWLRAGDVLRIRDLVPISSDAGSVQRDALRTFYIVETEYDMDAATLRIVPDTESMTLDALIARKL